MTSRGARREAIHEGRLTRYLGPPAGRAYTYDPNGNRTSLTIGAASYPYALAAGSNRLFATAGPGPVRSLGYDASGNLVSDSLRGFAYDARARLVAANAGSHSQVSYTYNAFGQRVRKSGGSPFESFFAYDAAGHLIGEYNANGVLAREIFWLEDIPVALRQGGEIFYIHTDHLNTPRLITDTQNRPRWRWDPDPFGELPPEENPSGLGRFTFNLRFPGQYFDAETGMHYNYLRDYDPSTGRYVEADPIGLAGGVNVYGYVNGNPISYVDPTGEIGLPGAAIGAGIELGIQAFKNYRAGCDVLGLGNYNWYDVGVAAAVGAVAPGGLASARTRPTRVERFPLCQNSSAVGGHVGEGTRGHVGSGT